MVTKNELRRINLRVYLQENRNKDLDELVTLTGYTKEYLQKQFKIIGIKPKIRGRKTDEEIEEYIKAHPQMSVTEIRKTLHVGEERVWRIKYRNGELKPKKKPQRHQSDQLCWDCKKACNSNECSWARAFEYPEGCTFRLKADRYGIKKYIRTCPQFELG